MSLRGGVLDPTVEQLFIGGCDERHRDKALRQLAKLQGRILPVLSSLRNDETAELLAIGSFDGKPSQDLLLVTSQRSIQGVGARFPNELEHSDVIETSIRRGDYYMIVVIETRTARLDYRPDDTDRFQHMIVFKVATPRVANQICAAIDRRISS